MNVWNYCISPPPCHSLVFCICKSSYSGHLGSIAGNFQDREKMRKEKEVRKRYGRFFYRFPDGESAADVYDRITGTAVRPN